METRRKKSLKVDNESNRASWTQSECCKDRASCHWVKLYWSHLSPLRSSSEAMSLWEKIGDRQMIQNSACDYVPQPFRYRSHSEGSGPWKGIISPLAVENSDQWFGRQRHKETPNCTAGDSATVQRLAKLCASHWTLPWTSIAGTTRGIDVSELYREERQGLHEPTESYVCRAPVFCDTPVETPDWGRLTPW